MKEASFYKKLDGNQVKCELCNHFCLIDDGKRGACKVRENRNGELFSLNYGLLVAQNIDPIEKKPLFHYLPGTRSYSIATVGCNFGCAFCQNWDISQAPKTGPLMGKKVSPEDVVREAKEAGCETIAHTYVEPTIFYEFARDVSLLAKKEGIKNVWVSNGFMAQPVLESMIEEGILDAINVDLKSFNEKFYLKTCKGQLPPIKENLKFLAKSPVWLEVTTLIIPGENDSEEEIREVAEFVYGLGEDIPWHVSAFYPAYKMMDVERTPPETLIRAREIGMEVGLKYVYTGNVPGLEGENTFCPECGEVVFKRVGFGLEKKDDGGKCKGCGCEIAGILLKL